MCTPKHVLLPILLFSFSIIYGQDRGDLISDTLLISYGRLDIEHVYVDFGLPEFLFPIDFDSVEIHKVVYWTLDAHGSDLIEASGIVTLPVGFDCEFPIMEFNHGTFYYDQAMSTLQTDAMQHFVGVPFAATGYVSVLPDYLGYGETPLSHPHPYGHARSEARTVVDILRASRQLCANYEVGLNEQIFLLGYSNGGHVTMAAHRELETYHSEEFNIVASAPCSGAYDMSGIMRDSMLFSDYFSNAFYLAFMTLSNQFVYGNIFDSLSEAFAAPYDSIIPLILNRENPQPFWRDSLPHPGYLIFQGDYYDAVAGNSQHAFNVALKDNDVFDWAPQAPVQMFYCEGDEQIPFVNALFTRDYMLSIGAENVTATNVGTDLNHNDCAYPALVSAKLWFELFREPCDPSGVLAIQSVEGYGIYPNPFSDYLFVSVPGDAEASLMELRIYDLPGRQLFSRDLFGSGTIQVTIPPMPPGSYFVVLKAGDRSYSQVMVRVH